jgi:hypothetical protein
VVAGAAAAILAGLALLAPYLGNHYKLEGETGPEEKTVILGKNFHPAGSAMAPLEKVRVLSLDVTHFQKVQTRLGKVGVKRGLLGKESRWTKTGDSVEIEVRLSRPAYAYLIAFRPDRVEEVCFPDSEDQAPPLADHMQYPPPEKPGVDYGLDEGEGLQVFVVVASSKPLPSFRDWKRQRGEVTWDWQKTVPDFIQQDEGQGRAFYISDIPGSMRAKGHELVQALRQQRLEPLAPFLAAGPGRPAVRHLLVLPSPALAGVPMEVLAEDYTVSYALSGTLHAHLRLQTKPIGRGLLALGDPIFQASKVSEKPQPVPPGGVLLTLVQPGSNAAQAGLRPNDVLLRYGETELKGTSDLKVLPASEDAAQRVAVTVWRQGQTLERRLNPGQLGVGLADPPAPQAWAEQRRRHGLLASRSGDDGWKELPGTRAETESLGRLFGPATPVKLLLDSDASEQNLNEMAQKGNLGQYRYLHLATHGEVDDSWALRSAGL